MAETRRTTSSGSSGRVATKLVALSSAGVVAVYAAGFYRTKAAADRLAEADAERRRPDHVPVDPVRLRSTELAASSPASNPRAAAAEPQPPAVSFTLPTRPAPQRPGHNEPNASPPAADTSAPTSGEPIAAVPATSEAVGPTVSEASISAQSEAAPSSPGMPAAPETSQAMAQAPPPKPVAQYKDGTYLGWGNCRHGDIQAAVTIAGGRIAEAKIAQCWTRYSCSWIDSIVPQVVLRQSPNVDYVSGATQSVDAFYWAVVDALSKAK